MTALDLMVCYSFEWRRKLENFEGDGNEKLGVKVGYHLENSVLAHFFTAYREFCYFSLFFFPFLYFSLHFFFLLGILGGGGRSLNENLRGGGHVPSSPASAASDSIPWPHERYDNQTQ